jgi:carbonic anhydrase/acetyltransferase-like protein (isoleucine patch superfamily)
MTCDHVAITRDLGDSPHLLLFATACYLLKFTLMLRAYQGLSPRIHESCYIDDSAQIIGEVEIGENSSVWMNAVIRGDVYAIRIGKNCSVQDCSVLHGMRHKYGVTLGDWITVGHSVTLHGCTIADRCLIGMGSVILNNAKVGEGSIIAAGTVIPENTVVEPFSLWAGVPGKFRKKTDDEQTQDMIMMYAKNYLDYTEIYKKEFPKR